MRLVARGHDERERRRRRMTCGAEEGIERDTYIGDDNKRGMLSIKMTRRVWRHGPHSLQLKHLNASLAFLNIYRPFTSFKPHRTHPLST